MPIHDAQQWRQFLSNIISDPQEKQRIANELGVHPLTLIRWINGDAKPRLQNLRHLLKILPEQHRTLLLELLPEEWKNVWDETILGDADSPEIPSTFYSRVLSAYCRLPKLLRFASICDLISQQALKQLDPHRIGMEITVVQCQAPSHENKVRSLRELMGRGTPPWKENLEPKTLFLGAESLAGYVVTSGRSVPIQSREEGVNLFPAHWVKWEESAMAYPLLRDNRVAGCLLFSSSQPNYFLPASRQALIEQYAELVAVAFESEEFYELSSIELYQMPPSDVQQPYVATFRKRVSQVMGEARRTEQVLSLLQAEQVVWQQLEAELIALSLRTEVRHPHHS